MSVQKIRFADLFAGIGGMRLGMEAAGFECVFSSEWDKHASKMYEANHGETPYGDITKIDENMVPDHEILVAGFPCQPFSISGKKEGFLDTRGTLFFDILRIVKAKQPQVVLLENVKHLSRHDNGRTLDVIIQSLNDAGYNVKHSVLNAAHYGVPQNRERTIIVATKNGTFSFDRLRKKEVTRLSDFLCDQGEFEHLNKEEYTLLDESVIKVQPSGLIFVGYRNKNMRKKGVRENTEHLSRSHKQPNRIYSSDGVHPTLNSQESSGRFFILHNHEVRKLTIKECYRIMGFPEDFRLIAPISECYKRIGNSVCVPMISELAHQIRIQNFGGDKI